MKKYEPDLGSASSILWSAAFAVIPPALYRAADRQSGVMELLLAAAFFISISAQFFLAIRYSKNIALLALLRWAFESFAVFGRGYRLHFYGFLTLCGGLAYLFKAAKRILDT